MSETARPYTPTHTVYYDRLCDASHALVYNTCTKFVTMTKYLIFFPPILSFLTRACVFLTGFPPHNVS